MRLARLGERGAERPVVLDGDRVLDASGVVADFEGDAFAPQSLDRLRAALADGSLPEVPDAAGLRIGSPLARPNAVICIGQNYAAHAAESGAEPPQNPIVFLKSPSSICGPDDELPLPPRAERADWEVELAFVIGTRALYLDSPADARDHIAGFLAADDISERAFQLDESGGQWSKGKTAPNFCPLGPWIATADELSSSGLSADDLRLRSWVNGDPRQDSRSSDLIFGIDELVWNLSQYMELVPGDVILTGTPQGVALSGRFPYLKEGDVLEIEIDGLGRQRQQVVGARA
ncbi:fumarylacetoacetate hydrolase family protein [Pseudolysinimonas sp.]|uniref:fumarylacetoacetate hydrolase family protein n=1 Tax=Pseudolysinimonas sp. TaxID=2680009 RepID=UPI003F7F93B1